MWKKASGTITGFKLTDGAPCYVQGWFASGTTKTVNTSLYVGDTASYICIAGTAHKYAESFYQG